MFTLLREFEIYFYLLHGLLDWYMFYAGGGMLVCVSKRRDVSYVCRGIARPAIKYPMNPIEMI